MSSIRKNLCDYLCRVSQLQIEAERFRISQCQNPYFQLETVFERIDQFRKGYLVPSDIAQFLLNNQLYLSEVELYLMFRDFDTERTGIITLDCFEKEMLPKEESSKQLCQQVKRRKHYMADVRLEIDLQFLVARFFEHKMKAITILATDRLAMHGKQSQSVQVAFGLLDVSKRGVISKVEQLDKFMRHNGKMMSKQQLSRIYRVLSLGRDRPITFDTFWQHFDPMARGYYANYSERVVEKQHLQRVYLQRQLQLNNQLERREQEMFQAITRSRLREEARLRAVQEDLDIIRGRI